MISQGEEVSFGLEENMTPTLVLEKINYALRIAESAK